MLVERIVAQGLAQYSYLLGDGQAALVIDPRRDVDVYIQMATEHGLAITQIVETHRHEDFVLGSVELASRTGAQIWHADAQLAYRYGQPVSAEQRWQVGHLALQALPTPGHTPGSMSYLLHDTDGAPWMVFTGDALFAGDLGRVDLLGMDRAPEMARLLYDSLYGTLLPLGDGILVCPAHGPGSVCGGSIAERTWTTIGLEKSLNPKLQYPDRATFVREVPVQLERPPYFDVTERLNVEGPPLIGPPPWVRPLSVSDFAQGIAERVVIDTRSPLGFGAAHLPGALAIEASSLATYAGWFVPYDRPIRLVNQTNDATEAARELVRLGFDQLDGYLSGGVHAWHSAGQPSEITSMVTVQDLCQRLDTGGESYILDVRSQQEVEDEPIPNAHHIHVTQIQARVNDVPRDRPVYIFCGSNRRAMVAASVMQRHGNTQGIVVLGGIAGWQSISCPLR